jgi:hypothetical protein
MFSFGYFFIQPLKLDLTEGSETSAKLNLTPGKYPKENIHDSEHGENLKSRRQIFFPHMICILSNMFEYQPEGDPWRVET